MDLLAEDWLRLGRDPNLGLPTSTEWLLTGALASLGVDEGAVLEEGVSNLKLVEIDSFWFFKFNIKI